MSLVPLLAKIELDLPGTPSQGSRIPSQLILTILVVIGVAVLLTGLIVLWAIFVRKPREVRDSTPRHTSTSPPVSETEDGRLRIRKKHRRRRRGHRGRNPTLAETGGLSGDSASPPPAS